MRIISTHKNTHYASSQTTFKDEKTAKHNTDGLEVEPGARLGLHVGLGAARSDNSSNNNNNNKMIINAYIYLDTYTYIDYTFIWIHCSIMVYSIFVTIEGIMLVNETNILA